MTLFLDIIHTIIRLSPIGAYFGTVISSLMFKDTRGTLLFIGLMVNELISLGYRLAFKVPNNPNCGIAKLDIGSDSGEPFVLPAPISQTMGFFVAFILMDMYYNEFKSGQFFLSIILLGATIWSRSAVGCKSIMDASFTTLVGLLLGMGYYILIKDYYKRDYKIGKGDQTASETKSADDKEKILFFNL